MAISFVDAKNIINQKCFLVLLEGTPTVQFFGSVDHLLIDTLIGWFQRNIDQRRNSFGPRRRGCLFCVSSFLRVYARVNIGPQMETQSPFAPTSRARGGC